LAAERPGGVVVTSPVRVCGAKVRWPRFLSGLFLIRSGRSRCAGLLVGLGCCRPVVFGVLAFGTVRPVFVSGVRQVLDQVLDPVEQGDARIPVVGDLVDEYPQVLVEQLAWNRLLDEIELCRARVVIAADPAQQELGEPLLSLISGDRCPFFGAVVSANHGDGVPLTGAVDTPAAAGQWVTASTAWGAR
jgi:hypothetical protein